MPRISILIPLIVALFLPLHPSAFASSAWYVNGVTGIDSNNCSSPTTACKTIRHAISLASSGDSIIVAAATYTENLTISKSLKVIGSAAPTTIIDGGGVNTVVTISSSSVLVTLSNFTIRNGRAAGGGGIANAGTLTVSKSTISGNSARGMPGFGGGMLNRGAVTVNTSTFTGNIVSGAFGAGFGGAIANFGTLTINNSTLSGNTAIAGGGGIDSEAGNLAINNSTLSRNSATGGGGIVIGGGKLTINNSTLAGNTAKASGGAVGNNGGNLAINNSTLSGNSATGGGGIFNSSTVTLQNSIVANNSPGDCSGTMTSHGYNLSGDGTCDFDGPGDLNNTNPMLGPLQYNGGPTKTMALPSGSPAVDAGNPIGCTDGQGHLLKTDQRGKPRPDAEDTGACDMGAFERQSD